MNRESGLYGFSERPAMDYGKDARGELLKDDARAHIVSNLVLQDVIWYILCILVYSIVVYKYIYTTYTHIYIYKYSLKLLGDDRKMSSFPCFCVWQV